MAQERPRGSIRLDDHVLNDASHARRRNQRAIVKQGVCLVPEGRRLFSGLNVEDHLRFGAYLVGSRQVSDDLARIYAIFPKLAERRRQDVRTLSGGEKQMVAIGRGLMSNPKLLMIDELALGLAPVVVNELVEALCRLNADAGLGIIVVDECLGRLSSSVSQVAFLAHGKLQAVLAPGQLSRETASLYLSLQD
jgi:branched-chain amino acid transport system ATP-binding protein